MQACRQTAVEAEDGSLIVSFRIRPEDKAEFFRRSPAPGDSIEIFAFEPLLIEHKPASKPAAQVVGVEAFESAEVMGGKPVSESAILALRLSQYPPFQQYVYEKNPGEVTDSERQSLEWILSMLEIRDVSLIPDGDRSLDRVFTGFTGWYKQKYGSHAVVFQ